MYGSRYSTRNVHDRRMLLEHSIDVNKKKSISLLFDFIQLKVFKGPDHLSFGIRTNRVFKRRER